MCGSDGVFAFLLLCIVLLNNSCNNAYCVFFRTLLHFVSSRIGRTGVLIPTTTMRVP